MHEIACKADLAIYLKVASPDNVGMYGRLLESCEKWFTRFARRVNYTPLELLLFLNKQKKNTTLCSLMSDWVFKKKKKILPHYFEAAVHWQW